METTDKSGKVKLTVELEINQPAMELIRGNVEMMSQVMPQLLQNLRESMKGKGGQGGHGMGMMMRHCQE